MRGADTASGEALPGPQSTLQAIDASHGLGNRPWCALRAENARQDVSTSRIAVWPKRGGEVKEPWPAVSTDAE